MNSIFESGAHKKLEGEIFRFLKSHKFEFSEYEINNPRSVGNAIEKTISKQFPNIISKTNIKYSDYSDASSRKAMEDFAFNSEGNFYKVDVMSHREDTKFNMPNLTSVKRLSDFYENSKNYFVIFLIRYSVNINELDIREVLVTPIEFLSWECLTLGALGWGQIQIKNSKNIKVHQCSRKLWMLQLCNHLLNNFYPKQAKNIKKREGRFKEVEDFWEKQQEG